jgi:type I restriction enzyme S subunit
LSEYRIQVPNLTEQKSIAVTLSSIDAKIEINNKICSELESLAQDLYHHSFTQFDFPDEKSNPSSSSSGMMVWNPELGQKFRRDGKYINL